MPPLRRLVHLALVLLSLAIAGSYYLFETSRIARLEEAIREGEATLREKENSLRDYREKVAFYKTEEGIEHLAREQYNLLGEGERVVLLRSPDAQE